MNFVQQPVRATLSAIALAIAALSTTGCGGGGSSDNNPPVVVTIDRYAFETTAATAATAAAAATTKVSDFARTETAAAQTATASVFAGDKAAAEAAVKAADDAAASAAAQVAEAKVKYEAAQAAADSLNPRSAAADASAASAKGSWEAAQAALTTASASLAKAKKLVGYYGTLDGAMNAATFPITTIEKVLVVNARAYIGDVPADAVAYAGNVKGVNVSDKSIQAILAWWGNGSQDALLEKLTAAITAIGSGHDARTAAVSDTAAKAAEQVPAGKEVKDLIVKLDELRRLRAMLVASGITPPAELDVVLTGYANAAVTNTAYARWAFFDVLAKM